MAANLLRQGWRVQVCDLVPERVKALVAAGAVAANTPAAAARGAQALIVCVVDAAQVEDVLFGPGGAAAAMEHGAAILLCPTISPDAVERFAAMLRERGLCPIDAPMSGGPARARDGSMSLMVACADAAYERQRPLLDALSNKVFRVGTRPGEGARTKLVNNLLAGINLAGAAEALALAQRLGLDPSRTLDVIEQSSGQSWIGSDRMRRAIAGDYAPRAHVTLLHKDTRLALDAASATGFAGTLGPAAHALFAQAVQAGFGDLDDAALFKLLSAHAAGEGVQGTSLRDELTAVKDHQFQPGAAPLRLKHYRLTRKLATGGMTVVYLARREGDGLPVVLKVLEASGKPTGQHLSRFIQESALLSRIDDPRVIRIYDQGFSDDHAYIALEYFERGDLRGEMRAGMAQQRVLEVVRQVAGALEVIHAHAIIHRDLKPGNIMLRPDGSVAVADFGIARSMLQQDNQAITQTVQEEAVGTPYYLSPEQVAGRELTPATDLYSLGVMLYEMLAGHRPYQADSLGLLLAQHLDAPVPRLPAEHEGLQRVLDQLMAKRVADRYPTARALLDDLRDRPLPRTQPGATPG